MRAVAAAPVGSRVSRGDQRRDASAGAPRAPDGPRGRRAPVAARQDGPSGPQSAAGGDVGVAPHPRPLLRAPGPHRLESLGPVRVWGHLATRAPPRGDTRRVPPRLHVHRPGARGRAPRLPRRPRQPPALFRPRGRRRAPRARPRMVATRLPREAPLRHPPPRPGQKTPRLRLARTSHHPVAHVLRVSVFRRGTHPRRRRGRAATRGARRGRFLLRRQSRPRARRRKRTTRRRKHRRRRIRIPRRRRRRRRRGRR